MQKLAGLRSGSTEKRDSMYKNILGDPQARRMFICWALTAGFLQFGYYGVSSWMPTYLESELGMNLKSMTDYMVGTYIAMILGKILTGMAADRIGRRTVFAFGAQGTALFLPVIVLFQSKENILRMLVVFGFLYDIRTA